MGQPSQENLHIFYEGNAGSSSPAVKAYYLPLNESAANNQTRIFEMANQASEKNMTYLSTYSGFAGLNINTANLSGSPSNKYIFAIFTPSGQLIDAASITTFHAVSKENASATFFNGVMGVLGVMVPLMAVVSAYTTFGRQKAGGEIDSVLTRPISRQKLILSRYVSSTASVFIASLASLAITSAVFYHYLGTYIPLGTLLNVLWALLVGIAGIIGLVYLVSNFTRSTRVMIGVALAFFLILDLFWTSQNPIIPEVVIFGILHYAPGSLLFYRSFVAFLYASPTGMMDIVQIFVPRSGFAGYFMGNTGYSMAAEGLSMGYAAAIGLVWIIVPIISATLIFRKKN